LLFNAPLNVSAVLGLSAAHASPSWALFENIEGGASAREFLEWFPGVTEQQARAALEHATRSLGLA
jgi:hypothetical protein